MAGESRTSQPGPRRQMLVVGATLLVIGLVMSVGAWQLGLHNSRGRSLAAVKVPDQANGQLDGPPPATTTAAAVLGGAGLSDEAPRLILVNSEEQAAWFRQGLARLEDERYHAGLPPLDMLVQQVADEAEAKAILWVYANANAGLALAGLSQVNVVDEVLR